MSSLKPSLALRTIVFVDGQNMYKGAREAFGWKQEKGHYGNFRPLGLGRLVTDDSKRELKQVRLYQGLPDSYRDELGNALTQRRLASWKADDPDLVEIITRPMKYPPPEGREKGIDVRLAIDLVSLAADNEYDLAVLASADTDLLPAIEFVVQKFKLKMVETVTWKPIPGCEQDTAAPLDIRGGGVIRRTIPKEAFDRIADRTNYMLQHKTGTRSLPGQSGRSLPANRRFANPS
jgi:uncharacterized LabA/DUF88 family protein